MSKKPWERELDGSPLCGNSDHIRVPGLSGTWYVVDESTEFGPRLLLLEDEEYGDEATHCIVDEYGYLVWRGCYNDWDDLREAVSDGTVEIMQDVESREWTIHRNIRWKGAFG